MYGFYGGYVHIIHFDRNKCLQNHAIKISVFKKKKKPLLRKHLLLALSPCLIQRHPPNSMIASGSINLFSAVQNKIQGSDRTIEIDNSLACSYFKNIDVSDIFHSDLN